MGNLSLTVDAVPVPAPVTVVETLPRDVAAFTGRAGELDRIVDGAAGPGAVLVIHTVDGMPGIGKTALATHAAHRLKERFPDGRLFVSLHAHTGDRAPADPAEVLAALLTARGFRPLDVPRTLDGRVGAWRDHTAGLRLLLVLDDAADERQVEPLLPGADGSVVLITSRTRLALDGAEPLTLPRLPRRQGVVLFSRLARRAPVGLADTFAIERAVALCGGLPLAISLLATRLAAHPTWHLTDFVEEFAAAQDRLEELRAGTRAVSTAFRLSYDELPFERRRLFRRLGLHPGPDLDAAAVAALDDTTPERARAALRVLDDRHLIEQPTPGRYRLHDLMRVYARALAAHDPENDRARAIDRLLGHYLDIATRREPADRRSAVPSSGARMRAERGNLLACLDHTAAHGPVRYLIDLTAATAGFMLREGPWTRAAELHSVAAAAARAHRLTADEATALDHLGVARRMLGDHEEAIELHARARALYREVGDRRGEADALDNLGLARRLRGEYATAAELHQRARELYREIGHVAGQAEAVDNLGAAHRMLGEYATAAELHEQASALFRATGNRHGEAHALDALGLAQRMLGRYAASAELHERAREMHHDLGDRLGEANATDHLGTTRRLLDDYAEAARLHARSRDLYRAIGDRLGEANAVGHLGRDRRMLDDYAGAEPLLEQARALYHAIGHRLGEANALDDLGDTRRMLGDPAAAAELHERAHALFHDIGSRHGEAKTLDNLGLARRVLGDPAAAAELHERAHALFHDIGNRIGEATALDRLGVARRELGDPAAAAELHERARAIYGAIGSRHGEADALDNLGTARRALGDLAAAAELHRQAAETHRAIGNRRGEADALDHLGTVRLALGDPAGAAEHHERARDLYRDLGDRKGELPAAARLRLSQGVPDERT
ncbi:tetratricopeptide repeat protein [Embleya scabrispora]|uniref:tetratricopeptide repeat protein n=1 Tax=Embleya scabrispora TaxID=159449 RepID=UPI00117D9664|nr:tetratricopeptide repeat protein [Embleya scabrispora]